MKKKISVFLVLFIMAVLCCMPVSAKAMSSANKKAHKAFTTQLKKDKKQYRSFDRRKLEYAYADVDGDKVDELITSPGYGYCTQILYDYQNGKVRKMAVTSQGNFTAYYPKHKIILIENAGHMRYFGTYYLKYAKKGYKTAAREMSYTGEPESITYYVNEKEVTEERYNAVTNSLVKGEKGKSFKRLKWRRY